MLSGYKQNEYYIIAFSFSSKLLANCFLLNDIVVIILILQTYDDFLDDVLSLDVASEAVADKSVHSASASMLDFLVKEEPLGEDDLKAMQKDRQKKDNHNMSKCIVCTQSVSI